jgi:hypothetical protein
MKKYIWSNASSVLDVFLKKYKINTWIGSSFGGMEYLHTVDLSSYMERIYKRLRNNIDLSDNRNQELTLRHFDTQT